MLYIVVADALCQSVVLNCPFIQSLSPRTFTPLCLQLQFISDIHDSKIWSFLNVTNSLLHCMLNDLHWISSSQTSCSRILTKRILPSSCITIGYHPQDTAASFSFSDTIGFPVTYSGSHARTHGLLASTNFASSPPQQLSFVSLVRLCSIVFVHFYAWCSRSSLIFISDVFFSYLFCTVRLSTYVCSI